MKQSIARLASGVAVMAMVFLVNHGATAAPITYNLVNVPSAQNGYSLLGQITTNGYLGTLSTSDIVSWEYRITKGAFVVAQSGETPSLSVGVASWSATATLSGLSLGTTEVIYLGPSNQLTVRWSPATNQYFASDASGTLWDTSTIGGVPFATSPGGGWIFATIGPPSAVPEIAPTTGCSALSLVAGVLAMIEQRRRRAALVA
jgi:hypothetical protein